MKQKVLLILFLGASLNFYAQKKDNYYTEIDKSLVDKHYSEGVISGTKSDDRSNDTKSVIEQ